jgi:hypothetical protein
MPNTTPNQPFPEPPADATAVADWTNVVSNEQLHRFFIGSQREVGDVEVSIVGIQNRDGSIYQRVIHITTTDGDSLLAELDRTDAGRLARVLFEAAAELAGLEASDAGRRRRGRPQAGERGRRRPAWPAKAACHDHAGD